MKNPYRSGDTYSKDVFIQGFIYTNGHLPVPATVTKIQINHGFAVGHVFFTVLNTPYQSRFDTGKNWLYDLPMGYSQFGDKCDDLRAAISNAFRDMVNPPRILVEERVEVHTDSKRFQGGKAIVPVGGKAKDIIDILPIGSNYRTVRVKRYTYTEPKWKKIEVEKSKKSFGVTMGPSENMERDLADL